MIKDSMLPMKGAWVQSQVGGTKSLHTLWYSQKEKKKLRKKKWGVEAKKNSLRLGI